MARRILLVVEFFPPHLGGGETLFGNMVRALVARGDHVDVVTAAVDGAPPHEQWHGANIYRVATPSAGKRYAFMVAALPRALRLARRADLIHTTTYNAAIPAWAIARLTRKPVVITVHEVWGPLWHRLPGLSRLLAWPYRWFEAAIFKLPFDAYICDSYATRRSLLQNTRVNADRAFVAYPAVDYDFWSQAFTPVDLTSAGIPAGTFTYLFFGRPGLSKGVEFLLDAAVQVREAIPNSRLLMLLSREPRSLRAAALERISRLGLSDHVIVREPVSRDALPRFLLATDQVVVPSLSEGFGYSAVEAATIGASVLTTTGHSVEEALRGHGRFVPPGDANALAAAIIEAARVKTRTPPLPPTFTLDAHVASVEAAYTTVLSSQATA